MKSQKLYLLIVLLLASCVAPAIPTPTPTETFIPKPAATQTLVPTPTITPAPTQVGGGSGKFIFTEEKHIFLKTFPDLGGETNVFIANFDGSNLTPVTNGLDGYNYLMDVSPNGEKILISSTSQYPNKEANLYLVDLASPEARVIKLAEGIPNNFGENTSAKFIDNSQVIYIGQGDNGIGIYKVGIDGTNPINIEKGNTPFELLAIDTSQVFWGAETKTNLCGHAIEVWQSSLEGNSERVPLEYNGKQIAFCSVNEPNLVVSPDGSKVAWVDGATGPDDPYSYLHIAPVSDINNPYTIQTLSAFVVLKWLPDGSKVLVLDLGSISFTSYEELELYFQNNPDEPLASSFKDLYGFYEVPISASLPIKNYRLPTEIMGSIFSGEVMELYDVSPDSRQIILSVSDKDDYLKLFNLDNLTFSELSGFTFTKYGIHWIP